MAELSTVNGNASINPTHCAGDSNDDAVTERLLTEYVVTRDPRHRDELARRYDRLVHWLAHKFAHHGAPIDDLI